MTPQESEKTESALRHLEAQGFDVKALWRKLSDDLAAQDRGVPTEDDVRYTLPLVAPDLATHFVDGVNQTLEASVLWGGYSYSLTAGQRAILRETYGLTPTQTITVSWVEPWPGTRHPRAMRLASDLHVDPRHRRHVLTAAVIREVGKFFREAAERDAAEATAKVASSLVEEALTVGRVLTLESVDRWAVKDITGVDVATKVEVTVVTPDRFTLQSLPTGNIASVPRKEFFETAREYATLYREPRARKQSPVGLTPALDALIASLLP